MYPSELGGRAKGQKVIEAISRLKYHKGVVRVQGAG